MIEIYRKIDKEETLVASVPDDNATLEKTLMGADEVIVTSSSLVCFAAEEIDGKPVGGRAPALLRQLQDALVKDFLEKTSL